MKVLIIEDNLRVSSLMKRGLESQGYEIYISEDAEDALVIVERISDTAFRCLVGLRLSTLTIYSPMFPTINHIASTPITVASIVNLDGCLECASGKIWEVAK